MWESAHNLPLWFMIISRVLPIFPNSTFKIMKSCSKPTAEKQGKIWWLTTQWGGWGVLLVQVVLGGFGWFLLFEDNFGWFQMICCFSSYTNFTACRRGNSLLFSWLHVIDWGRSFFYSKQNSKKKIIAALSPSSLKIGDHSLYSIVFYVR